MLLDQLFQTDTLKEIVIIRKNGKLFYKLVPVATQNSSQDSELTKPMFPISKERRGLGDLT